MLTGIIILILANILGGSVNPFLVKIGTQEISPLLLTFIRGLVAFLFLLPFIATKSKKTVFLKDKKILLHSILFGLNWSLFSIGIQFTTVLISQVLYTLVPLVVGIVSFIFLKEKVTVYKIVGGLVGGVGALFLIIQSQTGTSLQSLGTIHGNIIILAAMICWSVYVSFSKPILQRYSPVRITFADFFVSAILLIPFTIGEKLILGYGFSDLSQKGIYIALLLGFVSVLMFLLIQIGIKKTSSFTASLFFYFAPLFAALSAIPFLGEKITPQLVTGGMMIIIGVFIATTLQSVIQMYKAHE